ncbi:hypothetical protein EYF80_026249 [Liparis tanakae]|uniref:Uncharacterized protein n=1 Tax=Liparis tanakae TaxID=230148 RepID=A0A4Z2HC97_9TELE|nr:hypothetical protein EYF80_026249 [Liparis tanakae]
MLCPNLKSLKSCESSRRRREERGGKGGGGGAEGSLHAGAAVPARLTPPRLCGARLALLEERRLRALQTRVKAAAHD